jgi:hypothetical protein
MGMLAGAPDGWARTVRDLLYVAMAVFLVTIAIGIVNGLDLYEFNRDQLLTHVHSGTIGWISLGIVAATIWLYRAADRRLALGLAVAVPVYVAAFYSGSLPARAITGTILLVLILWLFVWTWQEARRRLTLPVLTVALGITSFTYGAIIGVLIQIQMASGNAIFPKNADFIGAHAGTMVFSYLVLAAMGLIEWRVKGTANRPTTGLVQVGALFLGGVVLALTLLLVGADSSDAGKNALQAAGGIDMLLQLIAVVLFVVRVLPTAVRTDWMASAPGQRYGMASLFVVVAIVLFIYEIFLFISGRTFDDPAVAGLAIALDHSVFIGVITNLTIGLALALTADRPAPSQALGQLAFWGQNAGLVVFMAGLMTNTQVLKQIGAPVMGVSILIGLAIIAMRLRASNLDEAASTDMAMGGPAMGPAQA